MLSFSAIVLSKPLKLTPLLMQIHASFAALLSRDGRQSCQNDAAFILRFSREEICTVTRLVTSSAESLLWK